MPEKIEMILVAIMLLAATLTFAFISKNSKIKTQHYDEMQLLIRAIAYRNAFFTVLGVLAVLMVLSSDIFGLEKIVDTATQMCTALMAGITVFAVYCIKKDAFFGIDYDRKGYVYMIFGVGLFNLVMGVLRVVDGTIRVDGVITFTHGASNLIIGAGFFIVLVALLLKKFDDKSEVGE